MANKEKLVRIPKVFLDDHEERDLPTPEVIRKTKQHYFIRKDDPATPELMSDADYYAEGGFEAEYNGLVRSARATLKALKEAGVTF